MSAPAHISSLLSDPAAAEEPEPPQERLRVSIVQEAGDWSRFDHPEAAVLAAARALSRHPSCAAAAGAEAGVVLADDALVRRLNATYRGKDAPTNVLSFPFQPPQGVPDDAAPYLGDVILAAETLGREAAERGIAPSAHLQHLVVHGLLHLLGFDHHADAEAEAMERLEAEILAVLGLPDPYAASDV